MHRRFATLGLAITGILSAASCGFAQNKKQPDPKELQKAYEAFARPGKEHKFFKRLAGTWSCTVKDYFSNPKQPTTTTGTAKFRVIMGGRFLQQQFRGKMGGQTFEGMGISGFDNSTKKYFTNWVDNMGTGATVMNGTYDSKTHTLTEIGTSSSPLGPMKMKNVSKYISKDKFLFTMYLVTPQGENKAMEITYTRAKKTK